jgi:hypothetical protein
MRRHGSPAWRLQLPTVWNKFIMKHNVEPQTWMDLWMNDLSSGKLVSELIRGMLEACVGHVCEVLLQENYENISYI